MMIIIEHTFCCKNLFNVSKIQPFTNHFLTGSTHIHIGLEKHHSFSYVCNFFDFEYLQFSILLLMALKYAV